MGSGGVPDDKTRINHDAVKPRQQGASQMPVSTAKPLNNHQSTQGGVHPAKPVPSVPSATPSRPPVSTPAPKAPSSAKSTSQAGMQPQSGIDGGVTRIHKQASPSVSVTSGDNEATRQHPMQKPQPKPSSPVTNPRPIQSTPSPAQGSGISLSDFDSAENYTSKVKTEKKRKFYVPGYVKVVLYLAAVITISCVLAVTMIKVGNDVFAFVKPDKQITITVDDDDSLEDVANKLYESNVIKYPGVYKWFSKFRMSKRTYLTENFITGEHIVNPSMNYDQLIAELSLQKSDKEVVRVTIPEGYTIYEILDILIEKRVMKESDRAEYIEQINTFAYDYDFAPEPLTKNSDGSYNTDKLYRLEGYLFPDTYDFYVGENPVAVIDKLLANFDRKFDESFYDRAKTLGYSIDQIITLASMIEAEGNNPEDFYKISSVFHNRLKASSSLPYLQSDATTLYFYQGEKKSLEKGDNEKLSHPYNTYLNKGLPPGAVCNPGYEAIHAALYPDSTNYYYFLTMSNGVTVYSRTLDEHNAAIARSNRLAQENN